MSANPRRRASATDPKRCIFKKAKTWSRRDPDAPQTPQARWNQSNRHKLRAHAEVRKALRTGDLKRGRCEVCGSLRVEAHHEDYTAPLSVTWLCRRHHKLWHAAEQKIENGGVALWIEALLSGGADVSGQ